jgi:hypothetical protein
VRKFGAASLPCNEKFGDGYRIKFITAHFDFYYLSTQINEQPNTMRYLLFFALLLANNLLRSAFIYMKTANSMISTSM